MRLIDWDEVLEWLHRQKETMEQWSMRIAIENYVDEMPTIEAEPIRHGHWIKEPDYDYQCSECGAYVGGGDIPKVFRYCPNCGSRMCEVEE